MYSTVLFLLAGKHQPDQTRLPPRGHIYILDAVVVVVLYLTTGIRVLYLLKALCSSSVETAETITK
jgi:hypothetical protein